MGFVCRVQVGVGYVTQEWAMCAWFSYDLGISRTMLTVGKQLIGT